MTKLFRFMKPYVGQLLLIVLLLIVQAFCDLALPDYMSRIVTNGIQQGGVESPVPKVLTQEEMYKLSSFMSKEDIEFLEEAYHPVREGSNYDNDFSKAVELEAVCLKDDVRRKTMDALEASFARAILSVKDVESGKLSGDKLPSEGDNIYQKLHNLPQEDKTALLSYIDNLMVQAGDSMIVQACVEYLLQQYSFMGADIGHIQVMYIFQMGLSMLAIALLSAAAMVSVGFLASRVSAAFSRDIRNAIYEKVEHFSSAEFDKFSTASLITRTTNDIQQIQMITVLMLRLIIYAPLLAIGGVLRALSHTTSLVWIIILSVCVLLGMIAVLFGLALPRFKKVQKMVDRLNLLARERLTGIMVVRAFNTQKHEEERFDKTNSDLTKLNLFVNRAMAILMPGMMFLLNITGVLVVWFGGGLVDAGAMQVGDMMAFMQYCTQVIMAFLFISVIFIQLPRASVSAKRVYEVLETDITIKNPASPKHISTVKGVVEFKDVSFRYPGADEYMLKDVSFTARPGETTAFIGATGSGKTTILNLLLRFYDTTDGRVKLDGVDVRDLELDELRGNIGYVPQKAVLFSGDIASNLRYAREKADLADLTLAANTAQAMEFINSKPEGFSTHIAQGGGNVSGGQKQRLAIARALVKRAKVCVFDDSFSALDFKTDAALRAALKRDTSDSTVMIVGQRISSIMEAEQIIVLEKGSIVGKGTHKELMENCKIYQEIAYSQLSKEELA